jgi:hypothetical protein
VRTQQFRRGDRSFQYRAVPSRIRTSPLGNARRRTRIVCAHDSRIFRPHTGAPFSEEKWEVTGADCTTGVSTNSCSAQRCRRLRPKTQRPRSGTKSCAASVAAQPHPPAPGALELPPPPTPPPLPPPAPGTIVVPASLGTQTAASQISPAAQPTQAAPLAAHAVLTSPLRQIPSVSQQPAQLVKLQLRPASCAPASCGPVPPSPPSGEPPSDMPGAPASGEPASRVPASGGPPSDRPASGAPASETGTPESEPPSSLPVPPSPPSGQS